VSSFQVYVNSFLALLNAQYYLQYSADSVKYRVHRDVYRPELHVNMLQDDNLPTSRNDVFKHPDGEVLRLTRPVQAIMVGACITVDGRGLNSNGI
jgi:hypothetical protein